MPGLAVLQGIASEIVPFQFDQVEGVKENAFVVVAVAHAIERSDPLVITGHRLAVYDAGPQAQKGHGSTISGKRWVRSLPGRL